MDTSSEQYQTLPETSLPKKPSVMTFLLTFFGLGGAAGLLSYYQVVSLPASEPLQALPNIAKATHSANQAAFVHLFEWDWQSIAEECENWLAPKGYDGVQISPPMEHIQGPQWWTRYQPVSHSLKRSRSGNETQLRDMIRRCEAVNVRVIIDTVINQMAIGAGKGTDGSVFSNRVFPGIPFGPEDFHHKAWNDTSNCDVTTYHSKHIVQYCDLNLLPDICTGCPKTRAKLARYLGKLKSLGRNIGLRMDAAKHQDSYELRQVLDDAGQPWNFQEVIFGPGEAVHPRMYQTNGLVTEFRYQNTVGKIFKSPGINLDSLASLGKDSWGMLPSNDAITFTDNHDSQRGSAPLNYKNGDLYYLFVQFTLATPYGYPKVLSGFSFASFDQGPPAHPANACAGGWLCDHRKPEVANMVGWRITAGGHQISHAMSDKSGNHLAFARGHAFVAFNRDEQESWQLLATTGLPEGTYCDITRSDELTTCPQILVDKSSMAKLIVPPLKAVAFHVGKKVYKKGVDAETKHSAKFFSKHRTASA